MPLRRGNWYCRSPAGGLSRGLQELSAAFMEMAFACSRSVVHVYQRGFVARRKNRDVDNYRNVWLKMTYFSWCEASTEGTTKGNLKPNLDYCRLRFVKTILGERPPEAMKRPTSVTGQAESPEVQEVYAQ